MPGSQRVVIPKEPMATAAKAGRNNKEILAMYGASIADFSYDRGESFTKTIGADLFAGK